MPYRADNNQFVVAVNSLKERAEGKNKLTVGAIRYLELFFVITQDTEFVKYSKDIEMRRGCIWGVVPKYCMVKSSPELPVDNTVPHGMPIRTRGVLVSIKGSHAASVVETFITGF